MRASARLALGERQGSPGPFLRGLAAAMSGRRVDAAPEEARIVDLSHHGRGVARLGDGKTVFVADTLPGERVTLKRTRRHRNYDEAELVTVLEASPQRVVAQC